MPLSRTRLGRRARLLTLALLGLGAAGCGRAEDGAFQLEGECRSPDGRLVAAAFTLSGGGAAGWLLTRVSVRPAAAALDRADFAAEVRHGGIEALVWTAPRRLGVRFDSGSVVHRFDTARAVDGAPVRLDSVRTAGASHATRCDARAAERDAAVGEQSAVAAPPRRL